MANLSELQATRDSLSAKMRELGDKYKNGQVWEGEDEATWNTLCAEYDANKASIDAENKLLADAAKRKADIESRLTALNADNRSPLIGRDGGKIEDGPQNKDRFGAEKPTEEDCALALQGWFLNQSDSGEAKEVHRKAAAKVGLNINAKALNIELPKNAARIQQAYRDGSIRNDLSSVQGSKGAYTFGESFIRDLELAMLAFGGVMQVGQIIRTASGEPLVWPTADDTDNTGEMLQEATTIGSSVDPSFGAQTWYAHKFSSKAIKVPYELLEDSAFDLVSVLSNMLGERLGRIQNTKFTTGTGGGIEPRGIVTGAVAGVTAASATAIAFDELIDLEHSLDPSRRKLPGVGYMFHDNILKALRKLKDGEGRYLWQAGANTGAPDTLNTYAYTINQDMASSIATSAVTVLFGQLSQYKIRQVNQIRFYRLVERYRDTDQDGFIAFIRGDGNILNAGDDPIRKLTQA